jgi:hypothetical protein
MINGKGAASAQPFRARFWLAFVAAAFSRA